MNIEQGNATQVINLLGFLRRRGKFVALVAGGIILLTFWLAMALPNLYTSSSTILVEPQSVDEDLVNSGVRESDLSERLGLMTAEILSRIRLSKIIDDMNLYEDESEDLQRIEVVELMRSYISVVPVLSELEEGQRRRDVKFNTFRIIFQHEDPRIAATVTQRIANDFINANIDARTDVTRKSLEFMEDEIESLTTELAEVERKIAEVKAESPGRSPEDFDSNQRMLQYAMGDLRDAQRILSSAQSDAAYWKNQALTASSMTGGEIRPALGTESGFSRSSAVLFSRWAIPLGTRTSFASRQRSRSCRTRFPQPASPPSTGRNPRSRSASRTLAPNRGAPSFAPQRLRRTSNDCGSRSPTWRRDSPKRRWCPKGSTP